MGLKLMPDFKELTALGRGKASGNDLEGVYYDLNFLGRAYTTRYLRRSGEGCSISFFREWNPRHLFKVLSLTKEAYSTCMVLPSLCFSHGSRGVCVWTIRWLLAGSGFYTIKEV